MYKKLVVLTLLLCGLLIAPVFGAAMLDGSRCLPGTDNPTGNYAINTSLGYSESLTCLVSSTSEAAGLLLQGWACTDFAPTVGYELSWSNGTIKDSPTHVQEWSGGLGYTPNGNGTVTNIETVYAGNATDIHGGISTPLCEVPGNYASIIGYKDSSAYSGNYIIVPYASWQFVEPGSIAPICSYTALPASGPIPLSVTFTDTSGGIPTSWSWQVRDNETGLLAASSSLNSWVALFNTPNKFYDVNFTASNGFGTCNVKSYRSISTPGPVNPATIVVNLDVKDAFTGALIHNAGVGIRNVSSGVWRNSTAPTGLVYFDSTGAAFEYRLSIGENITLAADGTGYKPDSVTFAIPYSNYKAYLNLVPLSTVNATGTFTLVVTVVSNKNGLPITGASVTLDTGDMKNSNSAGAATFKNVTAGSRQVTVLSPSGQGYGSAVQSVTGTSGETKMIVIQLVREGETPVPTYVSPTVTTIPAGNYSSGALNEQGSAGLVQMMGQIISLWPAVFLLGFIYFVRKTLGE